MKKELQVVGAIFVKEGKLFAPKRGQAKNPEVAYKYEFPGGKVEKGETEEQALLRELKEELNLTARVIAPFKKVMHEYSMYTISLSTFLCSMESEFTLSEHISAEWLPLSAIDSAQWAPADLAVLDALKHTDI